MMTSIDRSLAEQIVATIKDVCDHDINLISRAGIILASTDATRVGTYHEIGQRVARSGETLETMTDDSYEGTRRGINMPLYHDGQILAVVGITGDPDEVRQYAYLAERITNLLIREQELGQFSKSQADKRHYIVQSLIENDLQNQTYLTDSLQEMGIDLNGQYRTILIRIGSRYNLNNLSLIEQQVDRFYAQMDASLYTFLYPRDFVAILPAALCEREGHRLRILAQDYREILQVIVGRQTTLFHSAQSYQSCLTAQRTLRDKADENYVAFDDLRLEIVLASVQENGREAYLLRTIESLSEQDKALLRSYFAEDMSLAGTSARLYLHKNTVQYRLNAIHDKCGLNPRRFQDAVLLYLALQMEAT